MVVAVAENPRLLRGAAREGAETFSQGALLRRLGFRAQQAAKEVAVGVFELLHELLFVQDALIRDVARAELVGRRPLQRGQQVNGLFVIEARRARTLARKERFERFLAEVLEHQEAPLFVNAQDAGDGNAVLF